MEKSLIKDYDQELKILNFYHTALRNIGQMTLIGFTILVVERYYGQLKIKSYENLFIFITLSIFFINLYEVYILDKQLNKLSNLTENNLYTKNLSILPKIYGFLILLITIYVIYLLVNRLFK